MRTYTLSRGTCFAQALRNPRIIGSSRRGYVSCLGSHGERLLRAADAEDAVAALEVLTEVRVLKQELSPEEAEAGAQAVASMSAVKACDVLHTHLFSKGKQLSDETTLPLICRGLAAAGELTAFQDLFVAVESSLLEASGAGSTESEAAAGPLTSQHRAMRSLNMMLRQFAKVDVDGAVTRIQEYHAKGIIIEGTTYSQVAAASLTAGNFPQAEEMLEMRDYL